MPYSVCFRAATDIWPPTSCEYVWHMHIVCSKHMDQSLHCPDLHKLEYTTVGDLSTVKLHIRHDLLATLRACRNVAGSSPLPVQQVLQTRAAC